MPVSECEFITDRGLHIGVSEMSELWGVNVTGDRCMVCNIRWQGKGAWGADTIIRAVSHDY